MNAVQIQQVSFHFPPSKKQRQPRVVLNEISLSIGVGEIFGLLGPNGGGKTTLFRILSTSLRPTNGTVRIFDFESASQPESVRNVIGVVFQRPSLDGKLTVLENLKYHGRLYGLRGNDLDQRCQDVMSRFGISERSGDYVDHLSGGLQRRVEIAKGVLHKPRLLIMDEPSTGLDPGARRELWNTLFELKKDGVTVMLTTHLMEEGDNCDRLAILNRGVCVTAGTPADLKRRIGGDVINAHTANVPELCSRIRDKFGLAPVALEGRVRIEINDGHKFVPQLVESFPGLIAEVSVGKPTLEDVFVHETGLDFWRAEDRPARAL